MSTFADWTHPGDYRAQTDGVTFETDVNGNVIGDVTAEGNVEFNAQIEAQAEANANDVLHQSDRAQTTTASKSASTGLQGFPEDQQQPYDPKGNIYSQEYGGSCVAACGKMILSDANAGIDYYGGPIPESVIRQVAGVDAQDGASIGTLASAVPELGGPSGEFVTGGSLEDLKQATSEGTSAVASIKKLSENS